MITRRAFVLVPPLAVLAVAGCAPQPGGDTGDGSTTGATDLTSKLELVDLPLDTDGVPAAGRSTSDLGWELLRRDEKAGQDNLTLSPSSLVLALATVAEGASGDSKASLDKALGASGEERSRAYGALRQSLKDYDSLPDKVDAHNPPKSPVVHQANRVVIMEGQEVKQDYLDAVARYHGTETTRVPLESAKQELSDWASKHTAGLVKESAVDPDGSTVMVLQDAVLFAARWRQQFKRDDAELTFRGTGGEHRVKALTDTFHIPFHRGEAWEAARLFYDDALAMDVILPTGHPTDLDADQLWAVHDGLNTSAATEVELTMPPSRTEVRWSLLKPLEGLGASLADLSGIGEGVFAADVAQQTVLEVTAKGTVGAAVTEMHMPGSAPGEPPKPEKLVVDRPFIMRVLDVRTGWPLFLAIINNAPDGR